MSKRVLNNSTNSCKYCWITEPTWSIHLSLPEPSHAASPARPFGCRYQQRQPQRSPGPPASSCCGWRVHRAGEKVRLNQRSARLDGSLMPRSTEIQTQAQHGCRGCRSGCTTTHWSQSLCHAWRRKIPLEVKLNGHVGLLLQRPMCVSSDRPWGVNAEEYTLLYLWATDAINDACPLMMHRWRWSGGHHLLYLLSLSPFPSSPGQFTVRGSRW